MNFIIKLLLFKNIIMAVKYDSILLVVNKLIKYADFILWRKKGNVENIAKVMLKEIICNHNISQSIIFNRDKCFTFKFCNTWTRQLGTKVKLLAAYHSQTDG